MSTSIHTSAIVSSDGKIEVSAPELEPGQRVEVTIEVKEATTASPTRHVIDIVKDLPGHRVFKTAEEVDAYIREERDSWDR